MIRRAAAAALLAGAAAAQSGTPPAFVFVGPDWRMAIGHEEVYAFETFQPRPGAIALSVTLEDEASETLARLTGTSVGSDVVVEDADGTVITVSRLTEPITHRFAVVFADPEEARRAARRMLGQE